MTRNLEELEDHLRRVLNEAARQVSVANAGWQGPSHTSRMTRRLRGVARTRLRPRDLGGVIALGLGIAVAAAVVVVIASAGRRPLPTAAPGSAAAALDEAARTAGTTAFAPKLRTGQVWYTDEEIVHVSPALPGAPLRAREIRTWTSWNGGGGSAWGGISTGGGGGGFVGPPGFGEWSGSWVRQEDLRSPAGLLRAMNRFGGYFAYNVPGGSPVNDMDTSSLTKLAEAAAILGEARVPPAERAVVFLAIAQLPGLTYLGAVRDPLGRPGVGVAAEGSPRVLDVSAPQRYRLELIFDPSTGRVLGFRTVALEAVQAPTKRSEGVPRAEQVSPGELMFALAYKREAVIPAAEVPALVCATSSFPRVRCESIVSNSISKQAVRRPASPFVSTPNRHPLLPNLHGTPVTQINLRSPYPRRSAIGIAEIVRNGKQYAVGIVAQGLTPSTASTAYAVWLYNSPTDAVRLGYVQPRVGQSGRLQTAGGLPANAFKYRELLITLERPADHPSRPGHLILEGRWAR
jgi:hypothetical protein